VCGKPVSFRIVVNNFSHCINVVIAAWRRGVTVSVDWRWQPLSELSYNSTKSRTRRTGDRSCSFSVNSTLNSSCRSIQDSSVSHSSSKLVCTVTDVFQTNANLWTEPRRSITHGLGSRAAVWIWLASYQKLIKTEKNQAATGWSLSGKAVIQHLSEKMRFWCFDVFRGNAEALFRWDGKIKHYLNAYFLGKIFNKKYQNRFMYIEDIARREWDVLGTQCNCLFVELFVSKWSLRPRLSAF